MSLLTIESIRKMKKMGLNVDTGDFVEDLTTEDVNLVALPVGSRMKLGETLLEVTQTCTYQPSHRTNPKSLGGESVAIFVDILLTRT